MRPLQVINIYYCMCCVGREVVGVLFVGLPQRATSSLTVGSPSGWYKLYSTVVRDSARLAIEGWAG